MTCTVHITELFWCVLIVRLVALKVRNNFARPSTLICVFTLDVSLETTCMMIREWRMNNSNQTSLDQATSL